MHASYFKRNDYIHKLEEDAIRINCLNTHMGYWAANCAKKRERKNLRRAHYIRIKIVTDSSHLLCIWMIERLKFVAWWTRLGVLLELNFIDANQHRRVIRWNCAIKRAFMRYKQLEYMAYLWRWMHRSNHGSQHERKIHEFHFFLQFLLYFLLSCFQFYVLFSNISHDYPPTFCSVGIQCRANK